MKKAIVLLNMGGPNNLHEVELFLKNMFNDENILSIPSKGVRRFVAGLITTLRAEKAQEVYRELGGKSPLVEYTLQLCEAIEAASQGEFIVLPAMRYTPPFASEALQRIIDEEVEHIYLFPMYPQNSSTTTKSSVDDFLQTMQTLHIDITTTVMAHYYHDTLYNEAIIDTIVTTLDNDDASSIDLIFSAHGLPQKVIDKGDLYQKHVQAHVDILKAALKAKGVMFKSVNLAYQSKVGPMKWLEPSLEQMLEKRKKNKKALIYPIAFTIDNSETEFELVIEYQEIAKEMGYEYYKVVPALNNHPKFVEMVLERVKSC